MCNWYQQYYFTRKINHKKHNKKKADQTFYHKRLPHDPIISDALQITGWGFLGFVVFLVGLFFLSAFFKIYFVGFFFVF